MSTPPYPSSLSFRFIMRLDGNISALDMFLFNQVSFPRMMVGSEVSIRFSICGVLFLTL